MNVPPARPGCWPPRRGPAAFGLPDAWLCRRPSRRCPARGANDVRRAVGEEEFARAWSQGQAFTLDEAVALAARHGGGPKRPAAGWASLTTHVPHFSRRFSSGLAVPGQGSVIFV